MEDMRTLLLQHRYQGYPFPLRAVHYIGVKLGLHPSCLILLSGDRITLLPILGYGATLLIYLYHIPD